MEYNNYASWEKNLRDPYREAELCQQIGGLSAQSTVFLLPEHYNQDFYLDAESLEVVEIERVIKIAHSYTQAKNAVTTLHLEDERGHAYKAADLVIDGLSNVPAVIKYATQATELDMLMGEPRLCEASGKAWQDGYHTAYVQDYARPISEVLKDLDINNIEQVTGVMHLVDAFIDAQLLLCKYCLFEKTFKFTDNFGIFPYPELLSTDLERMRLLDLGELGSARSDLLELIRNRVWESLPDRHEYTQLHPAIQAYFNKQCEERLTANAVCQAWGTASGSVSLSKPTSYHRIYDTNMPKLLPPVLWRQVTGSKTNSPYVVE